MRMKRLNCTVWLSRVAIVFLLCGLGLSTGRCAEEIFALINGFPGDSTAPNHVGWTDVSFLNHGLTRVLPSNAQHAEITLTKRVDKSSPLLYDQANHGPAISSVQIDIIKSQPAFIQFYNITLNNAYVTSVRTSAGGEVPRENVTLAYGKISWTYTQVGTQGQESPSYTAVWTRTNDTGSSMDTDLDGMPDSYELANGLNPNVNDANGDLDHDGLTNYQEYLAGTSPNNFNSVFRVTRADLTNGLVRVTWTSVAGKTYTVHAANTVNGPYTPVRNVPSAGTGETFSDFPPSASRQFYRVSTP